MTEILGTFSPREKEVYEYICEKWDREKKIATAIEVASILAIAKKTVEAYVDRIKVKLNVEKKKDIPVYFSR